MRLSKKAFNSAQIALRQSRDEVNLTKTWSSVHNELGVGVLVGSRLILSDTDRKSLRQWFIDDLGVDPMHENLTGDRIEVVSKVNDEKLSSVPVFHNLIRIASFRPIALKNGNAITPEGSMLEVSPDEIVLEALSSITIIENGMAMRHWSGFEYSADIKDTLFIYRGHDQNQKDLKDWLKSLPDNISINGFFDFDPAGFSLAVQFSVDKLIVPKQLTPELKDKKVNKEDKYHEQIRCQANLLSKLRSEWHDYYNWLDKNHIALTQEKQLVLKLPLILI